MYVRVVYGYIVLVLCYVLADFVFLQQHENSYALYCAVLFPFIHSMPACMLQGQCPHNFACTQLRSTMVIKEQTISSLIHTPATLTEKARILYSITALQCIH